MHKRYHFIGLALFGFMLFAAQFSLAAPKPGIWMGKTDQDMLISFIVSDDGAAIIYFEITLDIECAAGGILNSRTITEGRITIIADSFTVEVENEGTYRGTFASTTVASGTWEHSTVHQVGGLCSGSGTWDATAGGYWLELDGVDDYIQATNSASLNVGDESSESLTIEAWVYPRSWPESNVSKTLASIAGKPGSYTLALRYDPGDQQNPRGFMFIAGERGIGASSSEYEPDRWYHIAGVFNNITNTIAIYVNGEESSDDSPFVGNLPTSPEDFLVGKPTIDGFEYLHGRIDELRISNVPRYQGNFDSPTERFTTDTDTRALWHFDEPEGSASFADASGSGNTLADPDWEPPIGNEVALQLLKGINMISVPLQPSSPWMLSDLSRFIGDKAIMIIWYDPSVGEFVTYMPDFPETSIANKEIKAGEGYIVVMSGPETVTFTGEGWNTSAAPSLVNSPMPRSILVVRGAIEQDNHSTANGSEISVRNTNSGIARTDIVGRTAGDGSYVMTFVDFAGTRAAETGDMLEIHITDPLGDLGRESFVYIVKPGDIDNYVAYLPDALLLAIPKKTMLLPNYPNPFNPETWIPYQLSEGSDVTISIHNVTGHLVRKFELGHKSAGIYRSKGKAAYWDGKNESGEELASGIYYYTMQTRSFSAMRKLVILR